MEYYENNLNYILEYDKKKSYQSILTMIILIAVVVLIFVSFKIEVSSYKEYYALKVEEESLLVSDILVEDTKDILNSTYVEIDNKKYPIRKIELINNKDNIPINYNAVSIEVDNIEELHDNTVIKVKYLYDEEPIINKVKKILQ